MELDTLKEIWRDDGEKKEQLPQNSEILDMLNKSSRGAVAKMIRNVLTEMMLVILLFGSVATYYFIAFKGQFSSIAWLYVITAAASTFYYYRKWKLLHTMQCVACQVKSNLKRQVNMLEKYIRFYVFAGTALVPAVFIFLGFLFYYKFPGGVLKPVFPPWDTITGKTWAIWTISLAVFTAIVWFGNRWYAGRLYGQHILKLKELLSQMEEV